MTEFHLIEPNLENFYRGIILFGANAASYKFALGKSLIELAANSDDLVPLEELASHFSAHIAEHVSHSPKQSTRNGRVRFFDLCERFNQGEATKDELVEFTVKNAFNDVIDRFHIINGQEIDRRFYIDERKTNNGIRLTDEIRTLVANFGGIDLSPEIEARWRLVETAWELRLSRNLISVGYDRKTEDLIVDKNHRRKNVTSCRNALNGYQRGKCFFCFEPISIKKNHSNVAHVDHFFPHLLREFGIGPLIDGVWNLVLSCSECNGSAGKGAKIPTLELVQRLKTRNEYLIESNHPLKETIILQTGATKRARHDFLEDKLNIALENGLRPSWRPQVKPQDFLMSTPHECRFCALPENRIVDETETCAVVRDLYPVTPLHTLIITKRHVASYFDLSDQERQDVHQLLDVHQQRISKEDQTISGFNIGINCGEDAGQTIMHCHVHLIPRRKGDTKNPRGGVRGVIPNKQSY